MLPRADSSGPQVSPNYRIEFCGTREPFEEPRLLYMVECRFNDPAREAAWNHWYGGERLGELLAVPGFLTSQRFIAATRPGNYYLTVHSIRSMEVFQSPAYLAMGGGAFKGYQGCITDWVRRFFSGLELAPRIAMDERLVVCDAGRAAVAGSGVAFAWMRPVGENDKGGERGVARIPAATADAQIWAKHWPIDIYSPMAEQRKGATGNG